MKLVVMIPAYNEEQTIGAVIREIPRDACEKVEVVVIDDGSTDNTYGEALKAGADKIVKFKRNRGLAPAFRAGLETALSMGADIIVNTDADGQYDGMEIPKLIKPILDRNADVVLGSRTKGTIEDMPLDKKAGNYIATLITRELSGCYISDAQTGFRAFTRDMALKLNVLSEYTYVQETLMQIASQGAVIVEVPINFRKRVGGRSRLIGNIYGYAKRAGATILRTYRDYQPLKTFLFIGGCFLLAGLITGANVLVYFFNTGIITGKLPTAVLTVLLLIIGFQSVVMGILADMLKSHKKVQDEILYRIKKLEYDE
ncbi:glycosyltransferase family 2 protein [Methanocella sp. CWC-04]|uniref:Glycosyltransferase family 2 protein n=1 Tax=Methanooceanicella nereidis TaxID=2052831 RepID=A0AAP2W750_9EURY|nr:glycosyltransferase family 2 protein [Methanocella sp. CWC-04]MCD1296038.1 glycosyltransferase family 2 protein [Methanocella sp. CWC-04]